MQHDCLDAELLCKNYLGLKRFSDFGVQEGTNNDANQKVKIF